MIDKQEVLLRLACAALQGGMSPTKALKSLQQEYCGEYVGECSLLDIAKYIYPKIFESSSEDKQTINTDRTY